jgi:actin beta/gamma 1
MFEEIYVPAFYLSNQAPLSLYSTGRTTGLVLDSGEDLTQVIPIKEGYHLPHSNIKSELAGRALT